MCPTDRSRTARSAARSCPASMASSIAVWTTAGRGWMRFTCTSRSRSPTASTWGFTESLTLQHAKTNVGQDPFNQDEMFNGTELDVFGWNYLPNVPKWNSVTSGTWRAPWGITLSGILSLNSGPAFGHIVGFGDPNDRHKARAASAISPGVYFPHKTFGYKRLDMRVAKTFKMPWGHELTVDSRRSTSSTGSTGPIRPGAPARATRRRSWSMASRQRPAPVPGRAKLQVLDLGFKFSGGGRQRLPPFSLG